MKENLNDKQGKTEKQRVVLAYGEVSGHAHAFYEPEKVELVESADIAETRLHIKETATLSHEEHASHVFEPGIAEVTIQNEYEMGAVTRVAD